MPLASLEKAFIDVLLQRQTNEAAFLSELKPLGSLSEKKQLSIYRSNINGAHQKVLRQVYPACFNILGEDYFNQLCRIYRFEYPSTNGDLNSYGEYFFVFIKKQLEQHDELSGLEYLVDLVCLEWHWHTSYFVKDDVPFSFEKLALVAEKIQNKLVFKLSYSFSLHSSIYPLLDIWNANKDSTEENQEFIMPETEGCFCISRVNHIPVVNLLNNQEYTLLKFISQGLTLAQLSELDSGHVGGFQNQLMNFVGRGWVSGFSIDV
jgi:hypothetical protein